MTRARADYKTLIRKKRRDHDKLETIKLQKLRFKNAKEYWKLLKGSSVKTRSCKLGADQFLDYFKSINDPNSRFFQPDEDVLYFNDRYLKGELQVMFDQLNVTISETEITKAIKCL